MAAENTSLREDADGGFFVFRDNRAGTANDPVPDAWNVSGRPLGFNAVRVHADERVKVDIDPARTSGTSICIPTTATTP